MLTLLTALILGLLVADDPPRPADDPLAAAKALADEENWEDAAEKYEAFLKEHPTDPKASEARFWLGYCLVKEGDSERAVEELRPFETALSKDRWADDALVQLGHAYRAMEQRDLAAGAWRKQLEAYPASVWRADVLNNLVEMLFYETHDRAACLAACEQAVRGIEDREASWEARYLGAYCLNALKRFDESKAWSDKWLAADDASETARRRLLDAQRAILQGRVEEAESALGSIEKDFPDLSTEERRDLLADACRILAETGRAERARALLTDALKRSGDASPDELGPLVEALETTVGEKPKSFFAAAEALLEDKTLSPAARMAVRERLIGRMREEDHASDALTLARKAAAQETSDAAKFRAAELAGEILADEMSDPAGAAKLLTELRPSLKRPDLVKRMDEMIKEYTEPNDDGVEIQ